jgi:glycosyltransferase involved in cell wall biosynthesis
MKVLYLYQYFTVPAGSYSTRAYEFARRWVKAGDSVTMVTSVYDKSGITPDRFISHFDIEGIDVRMINIRLSNKHGFLFRIATFCIYALLACWYALTVRADVVLASSGPLTIGIPALVARYLRRLPFVFEVRDLWPEGAIQLGMLRNPIAIRAARFLEKVCYRAASRVVALSEGMAQWIHEAHGLKDVIVIPNASDNELVASLDDSVQLPEWTNGKKLVLYTGTLGLIDDCSQILDVARIVGERNESDVDFIIIGDGKERPQLEARRAELVLKNVRFLGLLPKDAVMRWLKASSCALFTVKDVAFLETASPNKVFDAFAAGTPVIQATQGWIRNLIARENCGITVPRNEPEAMADAVLQVVHDQALRKELGDNARRVALGQFDRSFLASRMREVLLNAVRGKTVVSSSVELQEEPTAR